MKKCKFTPTDSNTQVMDHIMFHWRKIQNKREKAERNYWARKWDEQKRERDRQCMQALRQSRGEIVEPSIYPPWREMLEICEVHRHHLSEKDIDFLVSAVLWRRLNHEPSTAQLKWLSDIYKRVHTPLLRDEELAAFVRAKLR